ncbi:MAG TPA: phosphatase PAP2 family protein [Myxococcaceae bacterium]|nr:phosphatase PAP2 family protein [Myxococcaceae bacterium]
MRRALPILLALSVALPVLAGSTDEDRAHAPAPTATDHGAAPVSVYRLDLAWDIPVSAVAAAAIIVPYALTDSIIHPRCPCSISEVPGFDRWAVGHASDAMDTLSTVTAGLAMLAPFAVDLADVGPGTPFLEDSAVVAETLLVNGALVTLAKYTVQRPIPRVYSPGTPAYVNSPSDYRSFYSGHTSNAFAALTAMSMTWTLRHGGTWWPWVVTGVAGTSVALERVLAGRHFPSDVLAGAAAGTLVGLAVPWLHARARLGPGAVEIEPVGEGVMLAWEGRW